MDEIKKKNKSKKKKNESYMAKKIIKRYEEINKEYIDYVLGFLSKEDKEKKSLIKSECKKPICTNTELIREE